MTHQIEAQRLIASYFAILRFTRWVEDQGDAIIIITELTEALSLLCSALRSMTYLVV